MSQNIEEEEVDGRKAFNCLNTDCLKNETLQVKEIYNLSSINSGEPYWDKTVRIYELKGNEWNNKTEKEQLWDMGTKINYELPRQL